MADTCVSVVELAPPGTETPLFRGEFADEMKGEKAMNVIAYSRGVPLRVAFDSRCSFVWFAIETLGAVLNVKRSVTGAEPDRVVAAPAQASDHLTVGVGNGNLSG